VLLFDHTNIIATIIKNKNIKIIIKVFVNLAVILSNEIISTYIKSFTLEKTTRDFILLTFVIFYLDYRLAKNYNINIFGNDWSMFMAVSAILVIIMAYIFREKEIIGYSIILFLVWIISEGKIRTGTYFNIWFGVTFASRMIFLSIILIVLGYLHRKTRLSNRYKLFSNTYMFLGLLIIFVTAIEATLGNLINGSVFPIGIQSIIYTFIGFGISIYTFYYGLINDISFFSKLGLGFFCITVFSNLLKVFSFNFRNPILYIFVLVIGVLVGLLIEYTLKHKKELKAELLKGKA
jgi:hypothetical protein